MRFCSKLVFQRKSFELPKIILKLIKSKLQLLLVRISNFDLMILALQRTLIYFRGGLLNGIPLLILIKIMTLMTVINLNYQNIRAMR